MLAHGKHMRLSRAKLTSSHPRRWRHARLLLLARTLCSHQRNAARSHRHTHCLLPPHSCPLTAPLTGAITERRFLPGRPLLLHLLLVRAARYRSPLLLRP